MYLYIFEDGTLGKSDVFDDDSKEACGASILDVIDVGECVPTSYWNGKWWEIERL